MKALVIDSSAFKGHICEFRVEPEILPLKCRRIVRICISRYQTARTKTTAEAAAPSFRPMNPIPSVVVAFTET